jgi:hypothetical protein
MAAQDHNGGHSPSVNPTKVDHSLDDVARGLASGTISRGKALGWIGGSLLGAALASVPGMAWAYRQPSTKACQLYCANQFPSGPERAQCIWQGHRVRGHATSVS